MLKNILKTNGAQKLSKNELQAINGGKIAAHCPVGCAGKNEDDHCYASANCKCPGVCNTIAGIGFHCQLL